MESVWDKSVSRPKFDTLDKDINTEVLIIGGGIAGLLCAYKLKSKGIDCIVAEATEICGGITHCTTAKITLCHGLIYHKLIKRFGSKNAKRYLQAQLMAMDEYEKLCQSIECDYEKKASYVYSLKDKGKIEKEIIALKRLGINAEFSAADELPFEVAGAVLVKNQSQFHPLKFLYEIAKDLPIFEHTKITELKHNFAVTNGGKIGFKKLIIATHFPMINKHGGYFLKLYQHRSYVVSLKGVKKLNGMYVDESDTGLSFRSYGDLLLLGGGGHRTGKQGGCWSELEAFAKRNYKNATITGKWATQDCMTLDGMPYIGQYSDSTPYVYVSTGFNKWGMTNSLVSADIICDLICKKTNPYSDLFSPSRTVLHPQLAINAFESAFGLLTPTAPRCPHLGCALKYNHEEHTWDCPCHGSRFTEKGELIDNPATDDLKREL